MTAPFGRALVTGASSGIGEEFARQLAEAGTGLVLVARRAERLEALAAELAVDVEVLRADLATAAGVDAVIARLEVGDVDLLVNNAGSGIADPMVETDPDRLAQQLALNVTALARLMRAGLEPMVAAGRGAVVNVSSVSGFHPVPLTAAYAASKAFVTSLSEGVAHEVRGSGVLVQALCPGFTRTEFQEHSGYGGGNIPTIFWTGPEPVVAASLAALAKGGPTVVVPGPLNRVAISIARHVPHRLSLPIVAFTQRGRHRRHP